MSLNIPMFIVDLVDWLEGSFFFFVSSCFLFLFYGLVHYLSTLVHPFC